MVRWALGVLQGCPRPCSVSVLKKFANDMKLGQVLRCAMDRQILQDSQDKMIEWAGMWGMHFNTKKCMVMHYAQRNEVNPYFMDGERLQPTREESETEVLVSDTLKLGPQSAKAARKASTVLGQLTRAFHFRDRHTFICLYKQYVLPDLEFDVQAWSP